MNKSEAQATKGTDRDKYEFSTAQVLWAADRTLLAWVRTALSMIGFGFIIHQASKFLQQEGLLTNNDHFFGLGLWIFGIIVLIFASWEHFSLRQRLLQNKSLGALRRPLALMVAIGMCIAGSAGLIGFLFLRLS